MQQPRIRNSICISGVSVYEYLQNDLTDVFQTEHSENKRKVRKLLVGHIFENEDKAVVLMFKLALQSYSCFQAAKFGQKFIFGMLY